MRLELTNRTSIALRAVRTLEGRTTPTPRDGLATELGTTSAYLPQVIRPLILAGWIVSRPGPSGGYLPGTVGDASIRALIELVEGPIVDGICVFRDGRCADDEPCVMHEPWGRAREALMHELDTSPVLP